MRLISLLLGCVFFVFFIVCNNAQAGAYVNLISMLPGRVVLEITAWDEPEGIPNPCYGYQQCYVGPDVMYKSWNPGLDGSCRVAKACLEGAQKYRTTADVRRAYLAIKKLPYRAEFPIDYEATCVGLMYAGWLTSGRNGDGKPFPNSFCGKLPPPNQVCSVTMNSAIIEHGTLLNSELNGSRKDISGSVSCAIPEKVKITAFSADSGSNDVRLGSQGLYAKLFVNGKPAAGGDEVSINESNGTSSFMFSSVLNDSGSNIRAGKYVGNAIVVVNFM
ncbi:MrpH family fimbial adhesin [Serratia sp. TSA_198.1]|jgi:hypothetical protein|uniref:MrpH family fimbial adhesin n=1 Tax=Serratia sp. TSA_198.1 TaxID=3415664 RepID=UPI0040457F8F